jgi:hypothetical protein
MYVTQEAVQAEIAYRHEHAHTAALVQEALAVAHRDHPSFLRRLLTRTPRAEHTQHKGARRATPALP